MDTSIEKNIQRIKRFSLSCTLNDNGTLRHFHNGYEYVEIGGIKWAVCNVGAKKPTDSGLYFQWGDTQHGNTQATCLSLLLVHCLDIIVSLLLLTLSFFLINYFNKFTASVFLSNN